MHSEFHDFLTCKSLLICQKPIKGKFCVRKERSAPSVPHGDSMDLPMPCLSFAIMWIFCHCTWSMWFYFKVICPNIGRLSSVLYIRERPSFVVQGWGRSLGEAGPSIFFRHRRQGAQFWFRQREREGTQFSNWKGYYFTLFWLELIYSCNMHGFAIYILMSTYQLTSQMNC